MYSLRYVLCNVISLDCVYKISEYHLNLKYDKYTVKKWSRLYSINAFQFSKGQLHIDQSETHHSCMILLRAFQADFGWIYQNIIV